MKFTKNYNLKDKKFVYKSLDNILFHLHQKGIKSVAISFLISLEKSYYEGENLKTIFQNLKKITKNGVLKLNYKGVKTDFKISKIQIEIGDVLNRHNIYYRLCEKYLLENSLGSEKEIPKKNRQQFIKTAFKKSEQQGLDWFKNNIKALNILIPNKFKLNKDFNLNEKITTLHKGNKNTPKIELVRYKYWLKHKRYKKIEKILNEVRNWPDSIIERAYNHEANYFYERLSKRQKIFNKELFIKQSKKYLIDETMPVIIKHSDFDNILEFYFGGRENNHTQVCKGKKAKKDLKLQKYFETDLKGANKRKFVGIEIEKTNSQKS